MGADAPARHAEASTDAKVAALEAEVEGLKTQLERLGEKERMYRFAAEAGRHLVWYADADGRVIGLSRIFEAVTGIDERRALQGAWIEAIHPDDRNRYLEAWSKSLASGEPLSIELRSLRPDGSARTILARAAPTRDPNGRILRWHGSMQDIDDERKAEEARRQAEERLRESEQLHRFTLELTHQIVWSVEADGSGLALSPRYYRVTGMSPAEEPALSIHPDDRDRVQSSWAESLVSGKPYVSECRLRTRSGDYRHFRLRAAPLRDGRGRILRWYGVSEDVHEERLAERARRDVEERYRLAVQATNDVVWDYDVAADQLSWSDNSSRIFKAADEAIGPTGLDWWRCRIHPDDRQRVFGGFAKALAGKDTHWSASYRFLTGDDSYADMEDRGFIIRGDGGEAERAVGAMVDVTERNAAEAEIRRMQAELIHVSRLSAMGAMASTLAHELNQPLAALSNFISGAKRLVDRGSRAKAELIEALDDAASGAHRAGEIVRRLRELVSRGTVSVLVENLPKLIEEAGVVGFVDERALGIRHRLELDPKAQWVRADRIQIQQVLINLIRNGIEAMGESDIREIVIGTRKVGDMVEISVADTGTGIAADHFDTLFSRFMTTKSGGMGIGLPISRTIVELHGGQIWAENRATRGAVFRFTLPLARPGRGAIGKKGE